MFNSTRVSYDIYPWKWNAWREIKGSEDKPTLL